ncbi:hypothetical protein HZB00_00830 [Candidatus Woesearchaeota archaeon]|nr:hypothetical protein [Candidatus Woesearchaeota archaeon]
MTLDTIIQNLHNASQNREFREAFTNPRIDNEEKVDLLKGIAEVHGERSEFYINHQPTSVLSSAASHREEDLSAAASQLDPNTYKELKAKYFDPLSDEGKTAYYAELAKQGVARDVPDELKEAHKLLKSVERFEKLMARGDVETLFNEMYAEGVDLRDLPPHRQIVAAEGSRFDYIYHVKKIAEARTAKAIGLVKKHKGALDKQIEAMNQAQPGMGSALAGETMYKSYGHGTEVSYRKALQELEGRGYKRSDHKELNGLGFTYAFNEAVKKGKVKDIDAFKEAVKKHGEK